MTSREFCYWLQGYFELVGNADPMTKEQMALLRKHLDMVFIHEIDPSYPNSEALDKAHAGIPHTKSITLEDVQKLMEEEYPKMKKEFEEMIRDVRRYPPGGGAMRC